MVGQGVETRVSWSHAATLSTLLRVQAIDDAGIPAVLAAQQLQQLLARVPLLGDAVLDVRAVKAADVVAGVFQRKTLGDLGASAGVGGRGEGDAGDVRETLLEQVELQVVGSKIVPPLRDTVGLVNGEQRDGDLLQQREGAFLGEALRGDVEQVELPGPQRLLDPPGSISLQGGVQVRRPAPPTAPGRLPGLASGRSAAK